VRAGKKGLDEISRGLKTEGAEQSAYRLCEAYLLGFDFPSAITIEQLKGSFQEHKVLLREVHILNTQSAHTQKTRTCTHAHAHAHARPHTEAFSRESAGRHSRGRGGAGRAGHRMAPPHYRGAEHPGGLDTHLDAKGGEVDKALFCGRHLDALAGLEGDLARARRVGVLVRHPCWRAGGGGFRGSRGVGPRRTRRILPPCHILATWRPQEVRYFQRKRRYTGTPRVAQTGSI
jgi:hypothetical protein